MAAILSIERPERLTAGDLIMALNTVSPGPTISMADRISAFYIFNPHFTGHILIWPVPVFFQSSLLVTIPYPALESHEQSSAVISDDNGYHPPFNGKAH